MPDNQDSLQLDRAPLAGALTVFASVVAVLIIRAIAVAILHPSPRFEPLTIGPPIMDTVIAATIAVLVFLKVAENSVRPVRTWRRIALVVLIVSLWPDVALAQAHSMGGGWPEAYALMAMHVAVCALCVTMLPALVKSKAAAAVATKKT